MEIYRVARRAERGAIKFKAIFSLLVVAYVAFILFQVVPHLIDKYNLEDTMRTEARFAVVNRKEPDDIREGVWKKAKDLEIDKKAGLRREDIKVEYSGRQVNITVRYAVPLNLLVRQTDMQFELVVGDRAL